MTKRSRSCLRGSLLPRRPCSSPSRIGLMLQASLLATYIPHILLHRIAHSRGWTWHCSAQHSNRNAIMRAEIFLLCPRHTPRRPSRSATPYVLQAHDQEIFLQIVQPIHSFESHRLPPSCCSLTSALVAAFRISPWHPAKRSKLTLSISFHQGCIIHVRSHRR